MRRVISLFLALIMTQAVGVGGPVRAGEPQAREKTGTRWAVLIGVDDYNELGKLRFAGADQRALAEQLATVGFPPDQVFLLHDKAKQKKYLPSRENIEKQLDLVLGLAARDDLVIVGFSGHGLQLEGKSYFCPSDARLDKLAGTLIRLDDIYDRLTKCKAALKLLVVDACRNDVVPAGRRAVAVGGIGNFNETKEPPPAGILLLSSCGAGQVSLEDTAFGHGVFMHYVLEGLQGKAANQAGTVSLAGLYDFASLQTKKYVARKFNEYQTPALRGEINGPFEICTAGMAPIVIRPLHAALKGPTAATSQTVSTAVAVLTRSHLSHRTLDAETARRWVTNFLRAWDSGKYQLLQGDADRFLGRAGELGEAAKRGDISWAYEAFRLYLQRLDEHQRPIDAMLAVEPDYKVREEIVANPDELPYAADAAQWRQRWQKNIKYRLLELQAKDLGCQQAVQTLRRRYFSYCHQAERVDDDTLLEMCLTALAAAFDPHSSYMSAASVGVFNDLTRQQLEGVGAQLRLVEGEAVVQKVFPGGPADKDGRLKAGDRILAVAEGISSNFRDTTDLRLAESVAMIRGKPGTIVRLKVLPKDAVEPVYYDLVRARMQVAEARGTVVAHGQKPGGAPLKVGYITVPSLYSQAFAAATGANVKCSTSDVRQLLAEPGAGFKDQGVDVVLLDLRQNGGGALTEAINLPGLFLGPLPVVQAKDAQGKKATYNAQDKAATWEGPVVVLVSRNTASGAEVIAAALQDYGRALVVGDSSTNGMGTIRTAFDLNKERPGNPTASGLGTLLVATSQLHRLDGRGLQVDGLTADVVLPSLSGHSKLGECYQLHALPPGRIDPVPFTRVAWITPEYCRRLQSQSDQRCAASPDFARLRADIARLQQRQQLKTIPLTEDGVRAATEPLAEADARDSTSIFPLTYANREILDIAEDYWRLLNR